MKINLYLKHETEKAFCFQKQKEKTDEAIWLPKSQTKILSQEASEEGVPSFCSIEVENWLAEKNKLQGETEEASKPKERESKEVAKDHGFFAEEYDDDDIPF